MKNWIYLLLLILVQILIPPAISKSNADSLLGWLGVREIGKDSAETIAQSIDATTQSLIKLQNEFDHDVAKYLDKVDEISQSRLNEFNDAVGNNIGNIGDVVSKTLKDIARIEKQAYFDARELIWEVACLSEIYSQALKETLGESINILSEAEARISLPFIKGPKIEANKVTIKSPDQAYEDIKKLFSDVINNLGPNDNSLTVLQGYGNIARLARTTSCFYRNQTLDKYYLAEYAYYERLSQPWAEITGLGEL